MKNNLGLHKIELAATRHGVTPTIDGEMLPFCKSIDMECDMDEKEDIIKFVTDNQTLYSTIYRCDLSQYTKISCIILRDELLKHGDLYDAFSASIYSALNDIPEGTFIDEMPEIILKRIIGEE